MKIDVKDLINEFRHRINTLRNLNNYPNFYHAAAEVHEWMDDIELFKEPLTSLYYEFREFDWGRKDLEESDKKVFWRSAALAYGDFTYVVWDEYDNLSLKKLNKYYPKDAELQKELIIWGFNKISEFLYDILLLNKSYKTEKQYIDEYKLKQKLLNIKYSIKNHILLCGEKGSFGSVSFDPLKSIKEKNIAEEIIKILISSKNNITNLSTLKSRINGFTSNDFYTYITYLQKKFNNRTQKEDLKFHLLLIKDSKKINRGNPTLQLIAASLK